MSIQKDADEILQFIYDEYVKHNVRVGPSHLLKKFSEWDGPQLDRAVKYLRDVGDIDIILTLGNQNGLQNFILRKITPQGIAKREGGR